MIMLMRAAALLALSFAALASAADPTVVSEAGHKATAPEIAMAADGAINIIWIERTPEGESIAAAGAASKEGHTHLAKADVWFARSSDGGNRFSTPVRINGDSGSVWGFAISKPRVLASPDGVIHVFYPGNGIQKKTGKPIVMPMYVRSTDQGRTFSVPVALGSVPDSDNSDIVSGGLSNAECFGTIAIDDNGGVFAYWIDTRDMTKDHPNGKVFSAVSYDSGRSFGKDFEVFPADACPCCQITATVHEGRIYMGSRQVSAEGNRDSVIAVSTDRGKSFKPRVRWGGAPWKIEGCPLKPTTLAVDGSNVYAVAYDGGADPQGAYFSRSTDGGASFAPAVLIHPGAAVSDAPVIAVLDGKVIIAWHAKTVGERRVYISVSRDHGATFSAPAEVPAPAGAGIYPVIANRAGGIQIAWQQGDTIVTRQLTATDPLLGTRAAAAPAVQSVTPDEFGREIAATRGKVVMLNVWATWCSPCIKEIPDLVKIEADLGGKGFMLLGLCVDEPADAARVESFRQKYFAGFHSLLRNSADMDAVVGVVDPAWNDVVPTTYLIGRDGRTLSRIQGKKTADEFREVVLEALAGG